MKNVVGTLKQIKISSPGIYYSFRQIVSQYKYYRINYYYLRNRLGYSHWPREVKDTVIRVPPTVITDISEMKFDTVYDSGAIRGGDWDIPKKKFTESLQFQAVRARYLDGGSWEETEIFQTTAEELEQGEVRWGCSTVEDLKKRFMMIDGLYENIKNNGYKSKREIIAEHIDDPFLHFEPLDEVTVNIGRNGDLLFNDGAHRLSIALILGIEEIPVRVVGRHENWQGPWLWKNETVPDKMFPDPLRSSSSHHR